MRRARLTWLLPILVLLSAGPAFAQIVSGVLVEENSERPVADATVLLLDSGGIARAGGRTNAVGEWSVRGPRAGGWFSIRVQKAGFATVESERVLLGTKPLSLRLVTRPEVVLLEEVTSRRLTYEAILSRRERRMGYILDANDVARRMDRIRPDGTGRLLSGLLPGMETAPGRGELLIPSRAGRPGCSPFIVIDGKHYDPTFEDGSPRVPPWDIDELVPVWEVRAVEIYEEPWFVPSELGIKETAWMRCGVIVLWTYRAVGEE